MVIGKVSEIYGSGANGPTQSYIRECARCGKASTAVYVVVRTNR